MKLYLLRLRAGHTVARAAEECLTSKQNWSNWETGAHRLSQGHAKLYAALGYLRANHPAILSEIVVNTEALAAMSEDDVDVEVARLEEEK